MHCRLFVRVLSTYSTSQYLKVLLRMFRIRYVVPMTFDSRALSSACRKVYSKSRDCKEAWVVSSRKPLVRPPCYHLNWPLSPVIINPFCAFPMYLVEPYLSLSASAHHQKSVRRPIALCSIGSTHHVQHRPPKPSGASFLLSVFRCFTLCRRRAE